MRNPECKTRKSRSAGPRALCPAALCLIVLAFAGQAAAEHNATRMDELVVTATRTLKKVDEAPASVTVLTREDLKKNNYETLDEALRREAGVWIRRGRALQETTPNISMRGMGGGDRILVLINGLPANSGYDGSAPWNELPMGNVERIEISRGPSSALYGGNAMGGVVNVITKLPMDREAEVRAGFGSHDTYKYGLRAGDRYHDCLSVGAGFESEWTHGYPASLVARTPGAGAGATGGGFPANNNYDQYRWIVGDKGDNWADRWVADLTMALDTEDTAVWRMDFSYGRHKYGYGEPNSYADDGGYSGSIDIGGGQRVTYSPSHFISYAGIGQEDTANVALSLEDRFDDYALKVKTGYQRKDKWYTTPSGAGSYEDATGTLSESLTHSLFVDAQADRPLGQDHLLTFGTYLRHNIFGSDDYDLGFFRDETSKTTHTRITQGKDLMLALFAQDEWRMSETFTLYLGLRWDGWQAFEGKSGDLGQEESFPKPFDWAVSPRLSGVWTPRPDTFVRATAARSFRPPNLYELYRKWQGATTYHPNPNLKPETVTSFEIGADQYFLERELRLSATLFHSIFENAIMSTTVGTDNYKYNMDEARISGLEIETRYEPWDWLSLWANYTFNYAKAVDNEEDPTVEGKWLTNVPHDLVNLGADVKYGWATLSVSGNYQGTVFTNDL
ncbi:MAG: TonB-dependent receptor, partial [Desulfovibrionaceae bacterium]|nr:TonB-dependent receptor [Desulfovibrionaceae bacterium]